MPYEPKEPFQETHLESTEYRDRLLKKLNCLIAVLEVASAKVQKSLEAPDPDVERLTKIQQNLASTLEVCRRARNALERRQTAPRTLPENLAELIRRQQSARRGRRHQPRLPLGARYEMTSPEEFARFDSLGPITADEVGACDVDDLARRLSE